MQTKESLTRLPKNNQTSYTHIPTYSNRIISQLSNQKFIQYDENHNQADRKRSQLLLEKFKIKERSQISSILAAKEERMQKLKQLEDVKRTNIDELNIKIQNMVNKLSIQESPISSFVAYRPSKDRIKTQYTFSSHVRENSLASDCLLSNIILQDSKNNLAESQPAIESTYENLNTFSSKDRELLRQKSAKKFELQRIRNKYKSNDKSLVKSITFCPQSKESSESKVHAIAQKSNIKALSRAKNRISNRQSNVAKNFIDDKQNAIVDHLFAGNRKDINEEIQIYQRKVDGYNCKKQALLNECKKRSALQDATNSLNKGNNHHKQQDKRKIFCEQEENVSFMNFFKPTKEQNESEPPTADFRMPQEAFNGLQAFLSCLIVQIKFDEHFRNAKKWFQKILFEDKWEQLRNLLQQRGIQFDEQSIKQIFTSNEEQENPFISIKSKDFSIQAVVQAFIKCQENWFLNIVKKSSKNNLENDGFKEKKIDISHKGYLDIQDLVRFVNLSTNKQFRNRDLYLIYLRLKNQDKLTFQDIIEVICS